MRFTIEKNNAGETRIICKLFAIIPIIIGNELAIFETVYIRQKYSYCSGIGKWENIEFVTKQDYEDFHDIQKARKQKDC